MKVFDGIDQLGKPLPSSVLTIGNFDGVHRGHQQLLAQAGLFASHTSGPVAVLTFEPHPLTIVAPGRTPQRLMKLEEKLRLLEAAGTDITVVARSEPALLRLDADRFVEDVIHKWFHPTHIVEGPSFGFGRGRRGNAETLKNLASRFDCLVHIVEPVQLNIDPNETLLVSSSLIRRLLVDGSVRRAALCLGRPHVLIGKVVPGAKRGRELGFPTANLATEDQLVPGDGVYTGHATVCDRTHACAISVGPKPTFSPGKRIVEAHLLDFNGDLYDQTLRLEFDRRLRDQVRFDSPDDLITQLRQDVAAVQALQPDGETDVIEDTSRGAHS